jgi:hypothetical protein
MEQASVREEASGVLYAALPHLEETNRRWGSGRRVGAWAASCRRATQEGSGGMVLLRDTREAWARRGLLEPWHKRYLGRCGLRTRFGVGRRGATQLAHARDALERGITAWFA